MVAHVDDETAALARQCWGTLDTLHAVVYFAPEPRQRYQALGLDGRTGYFASRSAAMGAVGAAPTIAAFYSFAPRAVEAALPSAWSRTTPQAVTTARLDGVLAALHRLLGEPEVDEAVALARAACAGLTAAGRPLYAAHSTLDWPSHPLLLLWHAATLLREHRGDGHVSALLTAGIGPLEALVISGIASGNTEFLERSRGWTPEEWASTRAALVANGLLDSGDTLSERGRSLRATLEAQTDRAAAEGWARLGAVGSRRLLELTAPLRAAVLAGPDLPGWLGRRG